MLLDKTVCELFAGVGGFRLGLDQSSENWLTVWANQWEPGRKTQYAFDCYCNHFGYSENHVNNDISLIDKSTIPNHNLLVGGFPCQDYSVARTGAKGINGKKGVLWWEIRDIIEIKRPKFVLLENVDRLLKSPSSQKGRDFGVMLACLNDLGYSVEWRVINAAEYGFAQRRRRVFVFAYENSTTYAKNIQNISSQSILSRYGFFAEPFPIDGNFETKEKEMIYKTIADVSENFSFKFENSGLMSNGNVTSGHTVPIFEEATPIKKILERNVDERFYIDENLGKWEYLKNAKKVERISKTGHPYFFSEGSISFPDSIDKPARTMLTSESSINRSTHVIEDPETMKLRLITPIEAERIQGFEDNWTKTGMPEKFRYFCMGNALVVGLVKRMGHKLDKIFSNEVLAIKPEAQKEAI